MTWTAIIVLAMLAYSFKVLGMLVVGDRPLRGPVAEAARLLPASLLGALILVGTVSTDRSLVVDARLAGLVFAGLAAWRRWPFTVVVVGAAAVTAGVRLIAS